MKVFKSTVLSLILISLALCLTVSKAQATPILITDDGQLIGANNVNVDGSFFDVRFLDTDCAGVFGGICSRSSFTFQSQTAGFSAAAAIVDQVFNSAAGNPFDLNPSLIFGCSSVVSCQILIPINIFPGLLLNSAVVGNSNGLGASAGSTTNIRTTDNLALTANRVFASFTASVSQPSVPEPSAIVLMLGGIFGLLVMRNKLGYK
jgi:hypothetical protein